MKQPTSSLALVALAAVASYAAVPHAGSAWQSAPTWLPVALLVGAMLRVPAAWRPGLLVVAGLLHALGWHEFGASWTVSAGFGLAVAVAAGASHGRLTSGRAEVRLRDEGDVSRTIGAAALGAATATVTVAATLASTGSVATGVLLSVFLGTAAAVVVVVPLVVRIDTGAAPGRPGERVVASAITLVTSVAVFSDLIPAPVAFAVMPMFAWHAFRGSLREASWLLVALGAIATTATWLGVGPMAMLADRWGLDTAQVDAVLQLFLLDCGLILLPIAVVVAQHRRAVVAVTSERHSWRQLVQAAKGTAIVTLDASGRVVVVNPAAELLWGRTAAEVVDQPAEVLCDPAELHRLAAQLGAGGTTMSAVCAAAVAQGSPELAWHVTHADGSERVGQLTVSEVLDESGTPAGHLLVVVDVTERELTRQVLADSLAHEQAVAERLRELERVKGDFVATVSHELRTPIASIIGFTEMLVDGDVGEMSAAHRAVVERVDRNSRRLLTLVEDLLTLSEIETSRLRLAPEPTDLRAVVRASYDVAWPLLASRQLDVDLALPPHPVVIEADPAQLQRAVGKLLDNAVKFTGDGGRITVSVVTLADGAEVAVVDTGAGLQDVAAEAAFDRFTRGSTTFGQAVQGAGLGLTIVRAVVSLHGGRVDLLPVPDGGTQARVRLPSRVPGAARPHPAEWASP